MKDDLASLRNERTQTAMSGSWLEGDITAVHWYAVVCTHECKAQASRLDLAALAKLVDVKETS